MSEHARRMDRMYRFTRHVYDLSRRYYLLGRDRLLERIASSGARRVVEIGCGTARNLVKLSAMRPDMALYGIDAAGVMIETARRSVHRAAAEDRIQLRVALAENLNHATLFGEAEPFDAAFFSYSLSMMPTWPAALEAAGANVMPGGDVWIVDFWDQAKFPRLGAAALWQWLRLFHVHPSAELAGLLESHQAAGRAELESIVGRYAMLARLSVPIHPDGARWMVATRGAASPTAAHT